MFNYPAHHLFLNKALLYLDSLTQKIDLFKLVGRGKKVKPFFADKDVFLANLSRVVGNFGKALKVKIDSERTIEVAEIALQHKYDILGSGYITINRGEWCIDQKSGYCWEAGKWHAKYLKEKSVINADIKFPWEYSRCHHLLWLGSAYLINKDDKYAKEVVDTILDWIKQNPYNRTVNWSCSMEVAIRCINWLYAVSMISESPSINNDFISIFQNSLYDHGRHIYANLEYSTVYNANHYYSNIVGLIYLGILFKDNPKAKIWLNFAINEYCHETRMQYLPSGANYENSISYHRLTTEMALCGYYCIKRANIPLPVDIRARLIHALYFVAAYMKNSGAPLIGDNDDGRFLPIIKRSFSDHSYLTEVDSPELLVWSCDTESIIDKSLVDAIPRFYLGESGNAIIKTTDIYLFVSNSEPSRYVEYGKTFIPTHTHNDKLSFEVAIKGENIFIDPGTYCYTSDPSVRNEFRSTRKHNTIFVDDEEQNIIPDNNVFAITQNVHIDSLNVRVDAKKQYICEGSYSTYKERLHHERKFIVWEKQIEIIDIITKNGGDHKCISSFHLAPTIDVNVIDNNKILLHTEEGNELHMIIKTNADVQILVDEDTVSPHYGELKRSKTIRITFSFKDNESINYILSWK